MVSVPTTYSPCSVDLRCHPYFFLTLQSIACRQTDQTTTIHHHLTTKTTRLMNYNHTRQKTQNYHYKTTKTRTKQNCIQISTLPKNQHWTSTHRGEEESVTKSSWSRDLEYYYTSLFFSGINNMNNTNKAFQQHYNLTLHLDLKTNKHMHYTSLVFYILMISLCILTDISLLIRGDVCTDAST